jgi:HSP20 family protein
MAIIRRTESPASPMRSRDWDPFQAMREAMGWDPMGPLLPRAWYGEAGDLAFLPAFDVRETKDEYVFKADLPGFKEQDVDVNLTGNRLTVSGKRESEWTNDSDTCYCSERSHGSFARSFTLPSGADTEKTQADLSEGILTIHVPKTPETQPKRIQLQSKPASGGTKGQA